jgi:hypothetical protein
MTILLVLVLVLAVAVVIVAVTVIVLVLMAVAVAAAVVVVAAGRMLEQNKKHAGLSQPFSLSAAAAPPGGESCWGV